MDIASEYSNASIMFANMNGVDTLFDRFSTVNVLEIINDLFIRIDDLLDPLDARGMHVEKFKTVGDTYMCGAGLPSTAANHAECMAEMSFGITKVCSSAEVRADEGG